jgi:signal peptidase I
MRTTATTWGRRALTAAAGVLVGGAIALVVLVATGTATVVTTSGTSMQPRFHSGDLVLVRSSDRYDVGDVAAYRSRTLATTVLHRIVGRSRGRFTFKGDNNSWLDPDRPTSADLVGSEWVHVPVAGRVVTFFEHPLSAIALSAFVGVVLVGSVGTTAQAELRRRRPGRSRQRVATPIGPIVAPGPGALIPAGPPTRVVRARSRERAEAQAAAERAAAERAAATEAAATRGRRRDRGATDAAPPARHRPGRADRTALSVAAALVIAGLLLGTWAFLHPLDVTVVDHLGYEVVGELTYRAAVPATPVYDSTTVTTGAPVFLQLTDVVHLDVREDLRAQRLRDAAVTIGVNAVLDDRNGWTRRIDLAPPATTRGDRADVGVDLSLADLGRLLADVERTTGVRSTGWGLTVLVTSTSTGRLGGRALHDARAQRFELQLDGRRLRPVTKVTGGSRPAMVVRDRGAVPRRATEPAAIGALGAEITTRSARAVAILLVVAGALLGTAALLHARLRGPRTEAEQILARYGRRVVPVDQPPDPEGEATVDVARMSSLARMADHHDRLILHHREDETDTFLVDLGHTVYRYRARRVGWSYRDMTSPTSDHVDAGR